MNIRSGEKHDSLVDGPTWRMEILMGAELFWGGLIQNMARQTKMAPPTGHVEKNHLFRHNGHADKSSASAGSLSLSM
jgi:hypothetical protein